MTGEIYVLDQNVRPGASRDNFENSEAFEQLDQYVSETLRGIERSAFEFQEAHRKGEILKECSSAIFNWERRISEYAEAVGQGITPPTPFDDYEAVRRLDDAVEKLQNSRGQWKGQDKVTVEELKKRARQLQEYVRKELAPRSVNENLSADPEGVPSAKPVKLPPAPPPPKLKRSVPEQNMLDLPETTTARSLTQVAEAAGWDIFGTCSEVIKIVDASLRDLLGRDSDTYNRLLDKVDERLRWRGRGRKQ